MLATSVSFMRVKRNRAASFLRKNGVKLPAWQLAALLETTVWFHASRVHKELS
jgi:hypothetical protein